MSIDFAEKDWEFIEARLLRHKKYKNSEIRITASLRIRWWVDRLVNELYPNWIEGQAKHIAAGDEAKARASVIRGLDNISGKISRWENLADSSSFFAQIECEAQMEMDRPADYLKLDPGISSIQAIREIQKQQPGNFHHFQFSPGTLLALITYYQRAAARAEAKRLATKARYKRDYRKDTLTHEVFAANLATLWEEITGGPPKTSNHSGFHQLINYVYGLLGQPNRSASSLSRDLEKHFQMFSGRTPTNLLN